MTTKRMLHLLFGLALALGCVQTTQADDPGNDYDRNQNWPQPNVQTRVESRPDGVYVQIEVRQSSPGVYQPGGAPAPAAAVSAPGVGGGSWSTAAASSSAAPSGRTWTDNTGIHHETADGHQIWLTPPMIGNASAASWRTQLQQHPNERPYALYTDGQFGGIVWLPNSADAGTLRFGAPPAAASPVVAAPAAPAVTIDPREVALEALSHVPLPDIQIRMNPGLGLVALPGWFWVEGYDGQPFGTARTLEIPPAVGADVPTDLVPADDPRRQGTSITVDVRVWPSTYAWSFGDGASLTTQSLGKPYPQESDIQHTYEYSSLPFPDGFPVQLTVEFAAEYRVNGGPPEPLAAIQRTYEASYRVQEVQPVLTGH